MQSYTKDRREFRNFLRLAPIRNDVTGEMDQLVSTQPRRALNSMSSLRDCRYVRTERDKFVPSEMYFFL